MRNAFLAGAMGVAAISAPAAAQSPQDFYKGKTMTMLVGFSPGGGYDVYARQLVRHIGKHIPGHPDIVVQNLPGAGSLTAVRQLDATQPKDGTVIGTFNPGLITESLTSPEKTKFDFRNVAWVGSATRDFRVCYVMASLGVKTFDDLYKRKEVVLGSTAKGTGSYVNGAILKNLFNVNVRQVIGFPGSADQRLAIERGELDGDCGSWSSVPAEWVTEKKIVPLATFSPVDSPDLPKGVPYIGTFAKTQEQKDTLELLSAAGELGRPYIMSRAVPADRLEAVRAAFDATMKDPGFLAESQKQQLPINPVRGADAKTIIERIYTASPAVVAKAKEITE